MRFWPAPPSEPVPDKVPNREWYSRDLTIRLLNGAHRGYAEIAVKSDRLIKVKNRDGKTGYYRYAVDNEVNWAKGASSHDVRVRRAKDRWKRRLRKFAYLSGGGPFGG